MWVIIEKLKHQILRGLKFIIKNVNFIFVLPFMCFKFMLSIYKKIFGTFVRKSYIKLNKMIHKRTILVTGYTNDEKLKFLLEDVYRIRGRINMDQTEYESNEYKFLVLLGSERAIFNETKFIENCRRIKQLTGIICLENLNPRSLYLNENLEILKRAFGTHKLRELLYVIFTFTGQSSTLDQLRNDVLGFDGTFNILNINNNEKISFIEEKIWILHDPTYKPRFEFMKVSKFFEITFFLLFNFLLIFPLWYYHNNKSLTEADLDEFFKESTNLTKSVLNKTVEISTINATIDQTDLR
jgi:hypothetical protein